MPPAATSEPSLPRTLISLFRSVLYREDDPQGWEALLKLEPKVRDHISVIGLELFKDESEGYAFLRQRKPDPDEPELPRLVARRPLSYPVSLLLVLLRRKLAEHDALSGDTRLILTEEEIAELLRIFMQDTTNQARLLDRLHSDVEKVHQLGFLRKLKGKNDTWEVRRILKAYLDAQWLSDFNERLQRYREEGEA